MTESSTTPDDESRERVFRALFEESFSDIWRFARRRCDSDTDADDIAAEVFAIAWRRLADVPAEQARLWLFGVGRRVLANHRRSADRQTRLRARLMRDPTPTEITEPDDHTDSPLRQALSSLSRRDRELLTMQAWDGLSVSDIASILACSTNAVSIRLHKARKRLAKELHQKETAIEGHVPADPIKARAEYCE